MTLAERRVRDWALARAGDRSGVITRPDRPCALGAKAINVESRLSAPACRFAAVDRPKPLVEPSITDAPDSVAAPTVNPPAVVAVLTFLRVTSRCGPAETRINAPWPVMPGVAPSTT